MRRYPPRVPRTLTRLVGGYSTVSTASCLVLVAVLSSLQFVMDDLDAAMRTDALLNLLGH